MKKALLTLMCIAAMMAAGTSLKAQEVTIPLMPGWNWISIPTTDTLDFATALGSFTPMTGDVIKTQWQNAVYRNGHWIGPISQFYPGYGYKYYSSRTMPVLVTFNVPQPTPQVVVTTSEPTDITTNSATCGGNVASSNGDYMSVTLRGICWSTNPNPTFNDNYIEAGNGLGSFTVSMTELTPYTTYYVRAFAVTPTGTFYGDEISFFTQSWSNGILPGAFSVSANQQVYFSQGNLQYQPSTNTWRFATNQFDMIHNADDMVEYHDYWGRYYCNVEDEYTSSYSGWIDLFGWGTSGWYNGNVFYHPWDTQHNVHYSHGYGYGPTNGSSYMYNLTGIYANADWGVYNSIINGGNQSNEWRTLTIEEWRYVLFDRITASGIRYTKAQVNDVNGMILLPDDWSTFYYILNNTNDADASFSSNVITIEQWNILEQHGAVFLPAAGLRMHSYSPETGVTNATSLFGIGSEGNYWSSSCDFLGSDLPGANGMFWDGEMGIGWSISYRYYGHSVRLVCPAE